MTGEIIKTERVLKALANRRRLSVLKLLSSNKEMDVSEIALAIKLSFKSTSKHLTVLRLCDLVERDQRGPQVYYRLADKLDNISRYILSNI